MAFDDPHNVAQTKLLAELPYVGEEPITVPTISSARARTAANPSFAKCDEEPPRPLNRRFVDKAHIDDEWDHENLHHRERPPYLSHPFNQHQRQSSSRPTSKSVLGALLSDIHQQVAPFAGLIVTAALVAAAGLIFHMMAGGNESKATIDEFALPGFQVEAIGESLSMEESIPLADGSPTSETSKHKTANTESVDLEPPESAEQKVPDSDVKTSTPPIATAEIESTVPLGQLSFPQTETPLALDYSKATDPDLQKLPEVAERTEATEAESINR